MSILTHRIAISASMARSVAIATLLGATILAAPLLAARADDGTSAPSQLSPTAVHPVAASAATDAVAQKAETVEQRITNLHAALKITPDQEPKWKNVAQTMRDNSAAMQKLSAEKTMQDPKSMTAVEDLKTYEKFAQVHVNGLKKLTSSFATLYKSMPDPQKKNADQVFRGFGHERDPSRG
jgi:hypothetical protein